MDEKPVFPVGTEFVSRGRVCKVVDMYTTRNLAGEVVRVRYVATHQIMGQTVTDTEVLWTTIRKGVVEPVRHDPRC